MYDWEAAARDAETAIELEPDFVKPYFHVQKAYKKLKRYQEAKEMIEKAQQLAEPGNEELRVAMNEVRIFFDHDPLRQFYHEIGRGAGSIHQFQYIILIESGVHRRISPCKKPPPLIPTPARENTIVLKSLNPPPTMKTMILPNPKPPSQVNRLLKHNIDDYDIQREIGTGNYTSIFVATFTKTGEKFALKMGDRDKVRHLKKGHELNRERSILERSKHENIIQFYEGFLDESSIYMVLEHLDCELFDMVKKTGIAENLARHYLVQVGGRRE